LELKPRERLAISLLVFCGLRIGEMLSLRYSDVTDKKIDINKHMTQYGEKPSTKTGVDRVIAMPPTVYHLLDDRLLGSNKHLIEKEKRKKEDNKPLSVSYVPDVIAPILRSAGIKKAHHLRHFFASKILQKVTIVEASKVLGHKNPYVTLKIYGHLIEPSERIIYY
jgi:integrase